MKESEYLEERLLPLAAAYSLDAERISTALAELAEATKQDHALRMAFAYGSPAVIGMIVQTALAAIYCAMAREDLTKEWRKLR
jgi:hypothetical protein